MWKSAFASGSPDSTLTGPSPERVTSTVAVLRDGQIVFHDELDVLKDSVKRLRITAAHDLPRDFAVRGALRTEVAGPSALVAVTGVTGGLVDDLSATWNASVDIEHLSLEDIFLSLSGGAEEAGSGGAAPGGRRRPASWSACRPTIGP